MVTYRNVYLPPATDSQPAFWPLRLTFLKMVFGAKASLIYRIPKPRSLSMEHDIVARPYYVEASLTPRLL